MSKKSTDIKKMIQDIFDQNTKVRAAAVKTKKSIEKEIGFEIITKSNQEYNDSDYFWDVKIVSVGGVDISAGLHDLKEIDAEVILKALKKCKNSKGEKSNPEEELEDFTQDAIFQICIKTKKTPEEVLELLTDYLELVYLIQI